MSIKSTKLSNDAKAVLRAVAVLRTGAVLTVPAFSGYYTAGAYTPAIGPRGYAVYGYGRDTTAAREYTSTDAIEAAALALVSSCGSTRVREAAIAAAKKTA